MPPSDPPVMAGLLAGALESALGAYLALDEKHPARLAPLAGKSIALRFRPFEATVYLCPTDAAVRVLTGIDGSPDLTLSGTLPAFARRGFRNGSAEQNFAAGGIEMEGDADTARCLRDLFERIDIDWEAHLASVVGARFAASVWGFTRAGGTWVSSSTETFRADLAEYWQEESRTLPTGAETDAFLSAVDSLRCDYDRLEARVRRLEDGLGAAPAPTQAPVGP